jgi:hypothetical protein
MRKIVIEITEGTYQHLLQAAALRQMSGESTGATDQAFRKILKALEEGQESLLLKLRSEL